MQNGDIHINVAAVNIMLGLQVQSLGVFPQHVVPYSVTDRCVISVVRALSMERKAAHWRHVPNFLKFERNCLSTLSTAIITTC
jgi:hypothetical protein